MKTLPKRALILFAGVLGALLAVPEAQASFINGAITFAGGATFDTNSLKTATRVTSFSNVKVESRDGDFASFVNGGDSAAMAALWIFSPSTATPGLWSVGGFTFDLADSTIVMQTKQFLLITGTGTIIGNGFDNTFGTWSFTTQAPGAMGVFSFSASGQAVPESGSSLAFLGFALAAAELIRRKLAAA